MASDVDPEWSVALQLLGLAAGSTLEEAVADGLSDQFVASYFASEDRIVMAVPAEGLDPEDGVYVRAHEMVHAHQHRLHDLQSWTHHVPASLHGVHPSRSFAHFLRAVPTADTFGTNGAAEPNRLALTRPFRLRPSPAITLR